MIAIFLSVLKYWKHGATILLGTVLLASIYLAQTRGDKLDRLQNDYRGLQKIHQAQISSYERFFKNEKDRNEFEKSQFQKIRSAKNDKVLFNDGLRSAYDRLRERQSTHTAH